ncbi:9194_t:CDS:10 [Acaulospora morrowiae]|uniref:9194_t:CDS:1 n=1 Tax=Acaulospora morrowiae TaxID=94023 RepID=A0A9N8ZIB6_9GLOM|nr:9194_t:CDS:10 [Acaulospora morrowiae]
MPIAFETSVNDSTSFQIGGHTADQVKEVTTNSFANFEVLSQHGHALRQTTQGEQEPLKIQEELAQGPIAHSLEEITRDLPRLPQYQVSESEEDVVNVSASETTEERAAITSNAEEVRELSLEEKLLNDNEDYEMVLRAINVLKFQLQQAKEDICKLKSVKEKALKDPIQFIEDLRNGTNEKPPKRQFVFGVPEVDWSKYHTNPLEYKAKLGKYAKSMHISSCLMIFTQQTNHSEKEAADDSKELKKNPSQSPQEDSLDLTELVHRKAQELGLKVPQNVVSTRSKRRTDRGSDDNSICANPSKMVNSREMKSSSRMNKIASAASDSTVTTNISCSSMSSKHPGYNLPRIDGEQCRLEHLRANRYRKITNSLKTRTLKQSSASSSKNKRSGKVSKIKSTAKLSSGKRPRRPRVSGIAYMEAQPPPTLYMPDDDDEVSIKNVMMSVDKVGEPQKSQPCNYPAGPIHHGFCCDSCHKDPIEGMRFICLDCDESHEIDLCEKCMIEGSFENDHHKKSHRFTVVTNPIPPHFDMDYVPERVGEYSYLGLFPPAP